MPFTPFHLGPGLAIGMLFKKHINLASILLASIIVDIRAIYCLFIGNCQLHGPLHTFVGATFSAMFVIAGIYMFRRPLSQISDFFKIHQDYSLQSITAGALIGTWLHILLDAFIYSDMFPFWPSLTNPFLGMFSNAIVYNFCVLCFFIGGIIYLRKIVKNKTFK